MWNLIFYKTFICIYLAPLGLGCGMQGVCCYIQSLICGLWDLVPRPGIEPRPLHWELGVLIAGPPGKS